MRVIARLIIVSLLFLQTACVSSTDLKTDGQRASEACGDTFFGNLVGDKEGNRRCSSRKYTAIKAERKALEREFEAFMERDRQP